MNDLDNIILDASIKRASYIEDIRIFGNSAERWERVHDECDRPIADAKIERDGGLLCQVTTFGAKLSGKYGITGELTATLNPWQINDRLNKGELVTFL